MVVITLWATELLLINPIASPSVTAEFVRVVPEIVAVTVTPIVTVKVLAGASFEIDRATLPTGPLMV